jgi:hypothetical protein
MGVFVDWWATTLDFQDACISDWKVNIAVIQVTKGVWSYSSHPWAVAKST